MGTSVTDTTDTTTTVDPAAAAAAAGAASAVDANPPTDKVPPVTAVPDKYDLKLPAGSTVDPAIVERTAAKARALGLTNEAGQTLLDSEVADAVAREKALTAATTDAATKAQTALLDAWTPGTGPEWKKQQDAWTEAAKADPDIGGAKFNQSVELGGKAVARFGGDTFKAFLDSTGYGRHPEVLRFLAKVGAASSESTMATGASPSSTRGKTAAEIMYPEDGKSAA